MKTIKGLFIMVGVYLLLCYISGEPLLSINDFLNMAKMCGEKLWSFAAYVINVLFEIVSGGISYVH